MHSGFDLAATVIPERVTVSRKNRTHGSRFTRFTGITETLSDTCTNYTLLASVCVVCARRESSSSSSSSSPRLPTLKIKPPFIDCRALFLLSFPPSRSCFTLVRPFCQFDAFPTQSCVISRHESKFARHFVIRIYLSDVQRRFFRFFNAVGTIDGICLQKEPCQYDVCNPHVF